MLVKSNPIIKNVGIASHQLYVRHLNSYWVAGILFIVREKRACFFIYSKKKMVFSACRLVAIKNKKIKVFWYRGGGVCLLIVAQALLF